MKSNYKDELNFIEEVDRWYLSRLNGNKYDYFFLRSIAQYRCQMYLRRKEDVILANILALLYLPIILLKTRKKHRVLEKKKIKYLKIDYHMAYKIPPTIFERTFESSIKDSYLILDDLVFVVKLFIKNKIFVPELFVKFCLWISKTRPHLDQISPDYLLQYCEYSPTSSLRKLYLNEKKIKLVNVTHGEEFLSCRSAFSSFDICYAWDITPDYVYKMMRIEFNEFNIFNPCWDFPDLTGQFESKERMKIGILWPVLDRHKPDLLVESLNRLNKKLNFYIRPHPNPKYSILFDRYKNDLVDVDISNPYSENISDFITQCSLVIGYTSAVLVQAKYLGRHVVYIDDSNIQNVRKYHDYYKSVEVVKIENLANYLTDNYL